MAQVFIHNIPHRTRQAFMDEWDVPVDVVRGYNFWNIWKQRSEGWDLQEGSRVILLGSWLGKQGRPMQRRLMLEVAARDVHHWEVPTWNRAVAEIARWTGDTTAEVRRNGYTADKKAAQGPLFVLAWRPEPVRWIDAPAPADLRVGRNGWKVLDRDIPGIQARPPSQRTKTTASGGQGRRLDVAARNAVEARAMKAAHDWCRNQGWTDLTDTSQGKPWDWEATDTRGRRRYIEVKGTTGPANRFEVTAGEVKAARRHGPSHLLIAVHHIQLAHDAQGRVTARGGHIEVFDPWRPDKGVLSETRYTWSPEK